MLVRPASFRLREAFVLLVDSMSISWVRMASMASPML